MLHLQQGQWNQWITNYELHQEVQTHSIAVNSDRDQVKLKR